MHCRWCWCWLVPIQKLLPLLFARDRKLYSEPKGLTVGRAAVVLLFPAIVFFVCHGLQENENSTSLQDKLAPEKSTCMWPVDINKRYGVDAEGGSAAFAAVADSGAGAGGDLDQQLVRFGIVW